MSRPLRTLAAGAAVLGLGVDRRGLVAGGQDGGPEVQRLRAGLLGEVDGVRRADPGALAAEDAVIRIEDGKLWDGRTEGDVDGASGTHVALEGVGHIHRAGVLAESAADAGHLVHVAGLAGDGGREAPVDRLQPVDLRVRPDGDVVVVGRRGHARRGDAAGAVHGGEDLGQGDHLAADAGLSLDHQDLAAAVRQVQRCLQAGDAAADDEDVMVWRLPHADPLRWRGPPGPSSSSTASMSAISFTKALVQTLQMAVSFSRRMSMSSSFMRW